MKINNKGFTLAEVLITLGIIGIVCALTIPTMMQKQKEKATITALKKAYSVLSSAYALAVQENGDPRNWNLTALGSGLGAENMLNTLAPYLNITKNCGRYSGCLPNKIYKYLDGTPYGNFNTAQDRAKARLADGSLMMTYISDPTCSGNCGYIRIDINGDENPNQIGVDMFFFNIEKTRIIPTGVGSNTDCKNISAGNGSSCTAWVIFKENMDYLHCNNLSWNGPTKCQ